MLKFIAWTLENALRDDFVSGHIIRRGYIQKKRTRVNFVFLDKQRGNLRSLKEEYLLGGY